MGQCIDLTLLVSDHPIINPVQDVSGGSPVAVEGTELPIWGMEIDPAAAQVSSAPGLVVQHATGLVLHARTVTLHLPEPASSGSAVSLVDFLELCARAV